MGRVNIQAKGLHIAQLQNQVTKFQIIEPAQSLVCQMNLASVRLTFARNVNMVTIVLLAHRSVSHVFLVNTSTLQ
jgi:hypothetical protein